MQTKGILYYTDNKLDKEITRVVRSQILRVKGDMELVSVSLFPIKDFGKNIFLSLSRGPLTMFKQILTGLEAMTSEIVFFCEHDVLYPKEHFDFIPPSKETYYFDMNWWKVYASTGDAVTFEGKQLSGLCAYRNLLIKHYRARVERVEREGYNSRLTFEPGGHKRPRGIDDYPSEGYRSSVPMVDIRHSHNLTVFHGNMIKHPEGYPNKKFADEIPMWGKTKNQFRKFLAQVEERK